LIFDQTLPMKGNSLYRSEDPKNHIEEKWKEHRELRARNEKQIPNPNFPP